MSNPTGVILAGGQSRRMGIGPKALAPLGESHLIDAVIKRLNPQVGSIVVSGETDLQEYQLPIVQDVISGHHGPLTGLYSVMQYLRDNNLDNWLLICPCDAPFLPMDLAQRLQQAAEFENTQVSLVGYEAILQATFSLWRPDVLPVLKQAVLEQGKGGFKQVLPQLSHTVVEWETAQVSPFFNVNTLQDLNLAETLL